MNGRILTSAIERPHPHHHLDVSTAAWSHGYLFSMQSARSRDYVGIRVPPGSRVFAQVCQYGETSRGHRDSRRQQMRDD
jgi:hypothetical protein